MADNTTLSPGVGGDTIRELDRLGVKTQVVILDMGGSGAEDIASTPATQATLAAIKAKTDNIPAQGQALAAASVPVVLTAIQQTALTPPAAIAGFALEAGHLATIDTSTAKIPSQGQALAASSLPVVLTAIQQTALTPPAAITGFALEAGHLATIDTSTAKIPSQGQALAAASMPIVLTAIQIAAITPNKTNNNAVPGATNTGVLPVLANAAVPAWTEGNQVAESDDLAGARRVVLRPDVVLGAYSDGGSVAYTATTANGIVFSARWGDATRKCRILRVTVQVVCTAFTTAGLVARKMVFVRGFTVADTGGASVLPAANMNELQTAFGTTLMSDMRFGGFLVAGTGTADTNPIAIVSGWMAAVGNVIGGGSLVTLYEHKQGKKPLVLAQNEGFRIQLDAVETASTRQTFVNVEWDEGNNFE